MRSDGYTVKLIKQKQIVICCRAMDIFLKLLLFYAFLVQLGEFVMELEL